MERSAWPKSLSSSRKRAIKELLHAQKPTKNLRDLYDAHSQAGNNTGQSLFSEDLVGNVLRLFSNTLSLSSDAQFDEVLQLPTNACVMFEVSEKSESIKTSVLRIPARTMAILVPDPTISFAIPLNQAQFIASRYYTHHHLNLIGSRFNWKYFRCVHQIDQGCQATKLVQRTSQDPRLFLITYRGCHTCKIILKSPPLNLDSPSPRDDSTPLSFNTCLIAKQDDDDDNNPVFFNFLSVKQGAKVAQ